MTAREAIEKFHKETLDTIHGSMYQGFTGDELMSVIEEQLKEDKEEILKEIGE